MDLNYLYKLASLLDSRGKYVESDVVYDSMIRLAKGGKKYYGNQKTRPKPDFRPMPGARPNPNSPGLVPVQSTPPVAPQAAAPQVPPANDAVKPNVKPTVRGQMSQRIFYKLLNQFGDPSHLDDYLTISAPAIKEDFIREYNRLFGEGAYSNSLRSGELRSSPFKVRKNTPGSGANPNNQSSGAGRANSNTGARPGTGGSASAGGASPNAAGGAANNAGARPSGTGGSAAGGASPKPGGPSGYAGPKPKFDPIPENFNPIKAGANAAEYRRLILSQPGLRPEIAARLEMLVDRGLLDPKTGNWTRNLNDLQLSELERFYRNLGKAQNAVSDAASAGSKAGRGGAAAAAAAKASQFATKAANNPSTAKIVSALSKASTTLGALRPLLKVLPFLGFAASIPEMMNLVNKINQKGWEAIWNDPYDRAKAIGAISNTVSAAVSLAPGPLTPVALALAAIGIGSDVGADVARDAGDAAEGGEFKLFGKTLKQKSQQRKQQEAFDAGYNAKELDPQVVSALENSKSLLSSGKKIIDIINDQSMLAKYPWLNNNADPKNAQFRKNIVLLSKSLRAQQSPAQVSSPGATNQPGQSVYNNAQQSAQPEQSQQLRNHNDLLYKAYVDTVQTTNITLENLKNYRDQIITKINNLAPMYPNINAQLAITALDNRIRKYSAQAKPA